MNLGKICYLLNMVFVFFISNNVNFFFVVAGNELLRDVLSFLWGLTCSIPVSCWLNLFVFQKLKNVFLIKCLIRFSQVVTKLDFLAVTL